MITPMLRPDLFGALATPGTRSIDHRYPLALEWLAHRLERPAPPPQAGR